MATIFTQCRPNLRPEPVVSRILSTLIQSTTSVQAGAGNSEVAVLSAARDQYNNNLLQDTSLVNNLTVSIMWTVLQCASDCDKSYSNKLCFAVCAFVVVVAHRWTFRTEVHSDKCGLEARHVGCAATCRQRYQSRCLPVRRFHHQRGGTAEPASYRIPRVSCSLTGVPRSSEPGQDKRPGN